MTTSILTLAQIVDEHQVAVYQQQDQDTGAIIKELVLTFPEWEKLGKPPILEITIT